MALRAILENSQVPLLINNRLTNWPIVNYSNQDWCKLFGSRKLSFRCGDFQFTSSPKWEGTCRQESMTLEQFFAKSKNALDEWYYYDYKDMTTIFNRDGEIFDAFNWSDLGFHDISSENSTLWIGSGGAHTPCHMDAHGFNLVAQLHGRKLWILINPNEMDQLEPTRVPYEETTIYSGINFFTPGNLVSKLSNVYRIILEPGQVLCVPRHWWHYVENLETAISINTWIPCEQDVESQMDEALVQKFVHSFSRDIDEKFISLSDPVSNNVLEHLAERCLNYRSKVRSKIQIDEEHPDVTRLLPMTQEDLTLFVEEKSNGKNNSSEDEFDSSKIVINAFCHPEVIEKTREKFLQQFKLKSRS